MSKQLSNQSYKNLIVWQKSMDLVDAIYKVTELYPKDQLYGLTSQTVRSAISIPSNIAEGRRKGSEAEFKRFLRISYGSGAELETQIEIAKRRPFSSAIDFVPADKLLDEVMRMLNVLLRS
jgi:four helix bundle protein